jgi:hypothetical protein
MGSWYVGSVGTIVISAQTVEQGLVRRSLTTKTRRRWYNRMKATVKRELLM